MTCWPTIFANINIFDSKSVIFIASVYLCNNYILSILNLLGVSMGIKNLSGHKLERALNGDFRNELGYFEVKKE